MKLFPRNAGLSPVGEKFISVFALPFVLLNPLKKDEYEVLELVVSGFGI